MRVVKHRELISAKGLVPVDFSLVAIQLVANLAAGKLFCITDISCNLVLATSVGSAALKHVVVLELRVCMVTQTSNEGTAVRRCGTISHCNGSDIKAIDDTNETTIVDIATDATSISIGSSVSDSAVVRTVLVEAVLVRISTNAAKTVVRVVVVGNRSTEGAANGLTSCTHIAADTSDVVRRRYGCDVECRVDVLEGTAFSPTDSTVASATLVGEGAVDAEVLDGSVLHITEESLAVTYESQRVDAFLGVVLTEVRDLVALAVELTHVGSGRSADGLEVVNSCHVDIVRQDSLGITLTIVHQYREELHVVNCSQLIYSVNGLLDKLTVVKFLCYLESFLCCDVTIRVVILCLKHGGFPFGIFFFGNHAVSIQSAEVLEQFIGSCLHSDVCLAASMNFIEEIGEDVDEFHLGFAGSCVVDSTNGLYELILQVLRYVRILHDIFAIRFPVKVYNNLCSCGVAFQNLC